MPMRLSGLMSGMDTESIIQQLVEAKKTKVTKAVKAQKSLKYKQDAWKDLNKQIVNLYNKSLYNMRFQSSFLKKVTKVSNSNVVSVITGESAMNGVQNLTVAKLAKSAYLTGGVVNKTGKTAAGEDITGSTKLSDLDPTFSGTGSFRIETSDGTTNITLDENSTVSSFISALKSAGVNANFDEANGRIHISAKASGKDNDFNIIANDAVGQKALSMLGLSYSDDNIKKYYASIFDGTDANPPKTDSTSIANKITTDQNAYLTELKNRKTELEGKQADLKTAQTNLLAQIKTTLTSNSVAKAEWDKALQEAGATFSVDDYTTLSDEDKQIYTDALNKALNVAKANGAISENDKKTLETLQSDWNTNVTDLSNTEKSLASVNGQLEKDSNGDLQLTDDVKTSIETKIRTALALYEGLDNAAKASGATKTAGEDAEITLNGVKYTSSKNTFAVNGLTLTVSGTTSDPVTITTEDDTNGIYDMIKNFFKEYNTLINKMDKLYNADSAKGYDPLTDEEKDAMSDSAIEEWENKIKDSILRKDSVLGTFANEMKMIMMDGVEVDGKKMYLSNFGIGTLSYFSAPDNERNAYHIDGDPDDENTSGNADKLKSMIANDPDTVVSFFTKLSQKMYDKMFDLMKSKEGYSSAMTVYDDKKMQKDYDDYTTKIKELEKKLADYEDKWYAKFAAMETALAKMQNNASAVTSLLGG